jgi:hypothetical protein
MPTTLSPGKPGPRRASFALKGAMLVSVLLLGALVQITEQINFSVPQRGLTVMAATLDVPR